MILILGKNGQVSKALQERAPDRTLALSRDDCNLLYPDQLDLVLSPLLESGKFEALINASAYTQVDLAETEMAACQTINAESPIKIAKLCKQWNVPLVHFSSDYVYGSNGTEVLAEDSPCNPINFYGRSKLAADQGILSSGAAALIIRTSWVYDHQGKNFFTTMMKAFLAKPELTVVNDQIGSPTYAADIAVATFSLLTSFLKTRESDVVHVCNTGVLSWYDFAKAILALNSTNPSVLTQAIKPIPTSAWPTPAKRQLNSRLSIEKFKNKYRTQMRPVDDALADCFKRYLAQP